VLTNEDIQLIKDVHKEIETNRKAPITLYREAVTGTDPYTGEPIKTTTTETISAVIKGFHSIVGGERLLVGGVAIQEGDVKLSVDIETDLSGVKRVTIDGVNYFIYSVQPRGLGQPNRYEVILRRETQR
jgi:hypothetical protein